MLQSELRGSISCCLTCCLRAFQPASDLSPGVYDECMPVALAPLIVHACLRCCNDVALALYGTCAQQHLPMGLAYAGVKERAKQQWIMEVICCAG
jgi:hypothetical protein